MNNQQRMNDPEYRRLGLPMTSSLMKSAVKEINWRVNGTEKFWNNPDGATPILALKAAPLSEDDRLETNIARHSYVQHPPVRMCLQQPTDSTASTG